MEWSNYIYPIFIVHTSVYSVLVNIIRDACFYGYTALPNCFYLVNIYLILMFFYYRSFFLFFVFLFIYVILTFCNSILYSHSLI